MFEQFVAADFGFPHQRHCSLGYFTQIVRRNLGGHADRDARGAIEQEHRQPCRHAFGFFERTVVVGREINRAHADLVQQQAGNRRQPCLGVAHRGGAVAVTTAEVALAVDQGVAHRETLGQAHQRIVGRLVAMRVVLAKHITHHACALDRFGAGRQTHFVHRENDAPLHRLLTVGHVRQGTALDYRDRVVEIGALRIERQGQVVAVGQRRQRPATTSRWCSATTAVEIVACFVGDSRHQGWCRRQRMRVVLHLQRFLVRLRRSR